jgi:hypothetical protein
MGRLAISLSKWRVALLASGAICAGCGSPDLGTDVPHKPHDISGAKKGGGADLDLLPAPPGMKTGTSK